MTKYEIYFIETLFTDKKPLDPDLTALDSVLIWIQICSHSVLIWTWNHLYSVTLDLIDAYSELLTCSSN